MSVKFKHNGVWVDITSIKVKSSGNLIPVAGVFQKVGGSLVRVDALPAPTLTGVSPGTGTTGGGTSVTLTGTNFTGATSVTFNGTASVFSISNPTTIIATSPTHAAGAISISVTTSGGTVTAANLFTYITPSPTTINLLGSQIQAGYSGSLRIDSGTNRLYGQAPVAAWTGIITGTDANVAANSDYGQNPGMLEVSVDGGAYAPAPLSNNRYTLFAGLSHADHSVCFRIINGYSTAGFIPLNTTAMTITGQPPSISIASDLTQPGVVTTTGIWSTATIANTASGFTPVMIAPGDSTYGSNPASVRIKGAFNRLFVTGSTPFVFISKDGGLPNKYDVTTGNINGITVSESGSTSVYNVWSSGIGAQGTIGGFFAVGGDVTSIDIGSKRRLDQYGDSITEGANATPGDVETLYVASKLGMVGGTNGIDGLTINGGIALMNTILPLRTITSSDVAIIALGRNDVSGGITPQVQADYLTLINKVLTAGYGTVICRGILPQGGTATINPELWPVQNAALKLIVDTLANSNVKFVDTSSWIHWDSSDNTHPSAAGYLTVASFAEPAYRIALGL